MNRAHDSDPLLKTVDASLEASSRPFYNSRGIKTYIHLIKRKYSYVNIGELLSYAHMEPYQVEDEGHWFNQEQIDRFYEKAVRLTGNKNLAREAGRYAASPEAIGIMRQYILGLIEPGQAYEIVGKYAHNFTQSANYESKRIGKNRVEITATPKEGVVERPYQCDNRMGYWEAIALGFNYSLPQIEHPECLFKAGSTCRYIVSWQESRAVFWKRIRSYTALLLFALCFVFSFINPHFLLSTILPASALLIILLTLHAWRFEKKELNAAINSLKESTDKLLQQVNNNYNNILIANEVGLALSKQLDTDSILSNVIQIVKRRLDYDRCLILLTSPDKTRLIYRAGYGYTAKQLNILKDTSFHLDRTGSKGTFVVSFREQKPFLINNIDEIRDDLSPHSLEFAKLMGAKSFICCPIVFENESLGILAVDNIETKRPLVQSDINLLMGIAPEIGISIHNASLIEGKERQFKSMLQVLAVSIDARDFLTAGHSEGVTRYAVGIAKEMGMPKDYCEMIRVASLLHDYGKIAIRDSILKKEGKLTAEEYEEIKTHAAKTREILERVNFEGIYKVVPQIAGSHHEKFDGTGYPKGLKGEAIPLGARIIAVADVFEAITSKRHYRDPMPLDEAFNLLNREKDKQLDGKIVEAFINYYNKERNKLF